MEEQSQVEAVGGQRWMNNSPWRLEQVDGGDEQYPVESRFTVRHTPPDEQDPHFDRRRSISSVLRYNRPLPMNTTPVSNVAGRTQGRFLRSAVRQASFPSPVPSKPSR